jgi:hypothetical protein
LQLSIDEHGTAKKYLARLYGNISSSYMWQEHELAQENSVQIQRLYLFVSDCEYIQHCYQLEPDATGHLPLG